MGKNVKRGFRRWADVLGKSDKSNFTEGLTFESEWRRKE